MSTFAVTIEKITVRPHPNADLLELAQVGLYDAVILKGQFKTGDYVLYIPEQAIVPDRLIEELKLVGKLAGPQHNRVKAVKLRGALSQGIACRLADIDQMLGGDWGEMGAGIAHRAGTDFAEVLGITKWVPPIPTHLSGRVYPAPDQIQWVDIENIKRYPDLIQPNEPVVATEKIHGVCFALTLITDPTGEKPEVVHVSSKGFNEKGLALERDAKNLYWRAVHAHSLEAFARHVALRLCVEKVGLFGEVYGGGVQDLAYGVNVNQGAPGFLLFDIAYEDATGKTVWLDYQVFLATVAAINRELGYDEPVGTVPLVGSGVYSYDLFEHLAEGKSTLTGATNVREGIVLRPLRERDSYLGERAIAKLVGGGYLTRKGNTTEYQ